MEGSLMESKQNEWEDFFDRHAPYYMENVFTKNTVAEVDFILEELGSSTSVVGLDVIRLS
jgi:hypothetical protein